MLPAISRGQHAYILLRIHVLDEEPVIPKVKNSEDDDKSTDLLQKNRISHNTSPEMEGGAEQHTS